MFFKRIFGRDKPKESKIESVSIEALRERIDALKMEKLAAAQPKLTVDFNKIVEKKERILSGLKNLAAAESTEEVHAGLYKAVDEARRLFIDKLTRALQSVRPPNTTTSSDLITFDNSLTRAVNLMTDAIAAHYYYIARLFAQHLHLIKSYLRELQNFAKDIHIIVEKTLSEIRSLEDVSSKIVLHIDLVKQSENLRTNIAPLEQRAIDLDGLANTERAQLAQLIDDKEFKQLERSQQELKQIEHEFSQAKIVAAHTIFNFSRPLRKMRKLVTDGEYRMDGETAKILDICIENPIDIFQSDEKLAATAVLLSKMIELIEKNKISLETREHKKRVGDARSIIENKTLTELKENIEQLNSRKRALDDFHQKSPLLKKKTELEHALERHTLDLEHVKKSLEELRRDLQRSDEEINRNKNELEETASKVVSTTVKITS
jgi:hypothetical protein